MKLVVVSPPEDRPGELEVVRALFEGGLTRFHLRKPRWSNETTAAWLCGLPLPWRRRVILHSHHSLADRLGAGGIHFRDGEDHSPAPWVSRSCHQATTVKASLGRCQAVFMGPVFASLSKPGYGPMPEKTREELRALLAARTPAERITEVIAIGGIDGTGLADCHDLGFDGVAVLGAIWNTSDPVAAFITLDRKASAFTASATERIPAP